MLFRSFGTAGFEPGTSRSGTERITKLNIPLRYLTLIFIFFLISDGVWVHVPASGLNDGGFPRISESANWRFQFFFCALGNFIFFSFGTAGFEPGTSRSGTERITKLNISLRCLP